MENDINELCIDDECAPVINEESGRELKNKMSDFIEYYENHQDTPVEVWLPEKLKAELPEKRDDEINQISTDIISSLEVTEEKSKSLHKAITRGQSKESWFASEMCQATSNMSTQKSAEYLTNLDGAVKNANEALRNTITTNSGNVNMNPHLDGFIAEQYHAQTFNMNAEATGSPYRAEVLVPKEGETYGKNSVDIVIRDGNNKIVRKYQAKYYSNAQSTEKAFENGDYSYQRKLVPADQAGDIQTKSTDVIEAPDGTTSNPLTKEQAVKMKKEAQSGNWNELNWNEYKAKDLALGIGKNACMSAVQGAAIGTGMYVVQQLVDGEEIEADEVVERAVTSGADFGIKAATSGAIKVGVEKDIIKVIPKGTPASTIANIAFIGVEDAKVCGKMLTGEYTFKEGVDKLEETTVSATSGIVAMSDGAMVGGAIGTLLGPVGAAVGSFVGGTIGYMAGSQFGKMVVKVHQKIRDTVVKAVSTVAHKVSDAVEGIKSRLSMLFA